MQENKFNIIGLSTSEVIAARNQFGKNLLLFKKTNLFVETFVRTIKEPMIILLLVSALIYFINGKIGDGIFLSAAIIFQTSISIYQYSRSKNALAKLKELSLPKCKVIRNGEIVEIRSIDLVIGDSMLVEEGGSISADGIIIYSTDFSINESILTGESLPVSKDKANVDNLIYSGTTVAAGMAIATITAIGNQTKLGKIGLSLENIIEEKTPLEIQIANFVKKMVVIGVIVFLAVWGFNYYHSPHLLNSLLQSLTLAMSILPEEIPIAFTTFMALGAWRLMKMGIVVKQMKTVETLGSATVICIDKTGTITENKMSVAKLFLVEGNTISDKLESLNEEQIDLIRLGMWASEPIPFDPMEVALHQAYKQHAKVDERPNYKLVHEYPLSGKPPMTTHVVENKNGEILIAGKGAPEALIKLTTISAEQLLKINAAIDTLAKEGYRLLAIGVSDNKGKKYPAKQEDFHFELKGLIAFYDPPKQNIAKVLQDFYNAGIGVKIITGDNAATTIAIANQIGFVGIDNSITGDELMKLNDEQLQKCVIDTNIFSRMFPEAKLKIITALKNQNQIVAMTGDGVNDGPALKAAHVGIAMGKKGTEIAKQAASLILIDDDLSKMVDAIAMGRKIYANLKKAIQYIISIHIPIILIVFIPLAFNWLYPNIFSPIHVIFLEIIMGPTCSIIYENEPMENNLMLLKPKPLSYTFFNFSELAVSIIQGLVIAAFALLTYQYAIYNQYNEALTRTMTFTVLITANVFLTLINRSFYYSIFTTIQYKNNMVVLIILSTIAIVSLLLFVKPLTAFFEFETLNSMQLLLSIVIGFGSVVWIEIVKWIKRMYDKHSITNQ
jgi:P-type Ca2+ transporter type 2C